MAAQLTHLGSIRNTQTMLWLWLGGGRKRQWIVKHRNEMLRQWPHYKSSTSASSALYTSGGSGLAAGELCVAAQHISSQSRLARPLKSEKSSEEKRSRPEISISSQCKLAAMKWLNAAPDSRHGWRQWRPLNLCSAMKRISNRAAAKEKWLSGCRLAQWRLASICSRRPSF